MIVEKFSRNPKMGNNEIMRLIADELGRGGWAKSCTVRLINGTVFLGRPMAVSASEIKDGEWKALIQFHNTINGQDQWCSLDAIESLTT